MTAPQQPTPGQPQQPQHVDVPSPLTQPPTPQQPPAPAPTPVQTGFDQQGRVVAGAGVPSEFVGKTLQEIAGIYGNTRNELIRLASPLRQPPQPQSTQPAQPSPTPQPQPAVGQPSQPGVPAGRPPQMSAAQFFQDPVAAIKGILKEEIAAVQAPQVAQSIVQRMEGELPRFRELRASVEQYMSGLPPQAQSNPDAWMVAYKMAVADAAMAAPQQPAQPQQPQQPTFVPAGPGPQAMGQHQPWQASFVEAPSPLSGNGGATGLSAAEIEYAARIGITPQQYAEGKRITFGGG